MKRFILFLLCCFLAKHTFSQIQKYELLVRGKDIIIKMFLLSDSTFAFYNSWFSHDMAGNGPVMLGHYIRNGVVLEMKDDNSAYVFSFKKEGNLLIPIKTFPYMLKDTLKSDEVYAAEERYIYTSRSQVKTCICDKRSANISPQGIFHHDEFLSSRKEDRGDWFSFKNDKFIFCHANMLMLSGRWKTKNGIVILYDENTGSVLTVKLISKTEICLIDFPIRSYRIYYKR